MSDLLQALIDGGFSPSNAIRTSNAINAAIKLSATTSPAATQAASSSPAAAAQFTAPASVSTPSSGTESSGLASFSGDSVFSGPMTISGEVNWGGMTRSPTPVSAIGAMGADSGGLFFQPLEFAALNDFGLGKPQQVSLSVTPGSVVSVLTGVSLSAPPTTVTSAESGAFWPVKGDVTIPIKAVGSVDYSEHSVLNYLSHFSATAKTFGYPTQWKLDPDNCTITASGTQTITYITTASLEKVPQTVSRITGTPAAENSVVNLLTGGTVSVTGPSVSVVGSASITTSTVTVGSALGGVVSAAIVDPPS